MAMFHFLVVAIGYAVMTTMADGREGCCFPDISTMDIEQSGKKIFTVYADWTKNKVFYDYRGTNSDVMWRLFDMDLESESLYVKMADGSCRHKALPVVRFFQCVPRHAVYQTVQPENGVVLDAWSFNTSANVHHVLTVQRNGCIPRRFTIQFGDKNIVNDITNIMNVVGDPSVFDTDTSSCVAESLVCASCGSV